MASLVGHIHRVRGRTAVPKAIFAGSVATGIADNRRSPSALPFRCDFPRNENQSRRARGESGRAVRRRPARGVALSRLLPNITAGASEESQQINLAAFGLSLPGFPKIVSAPSA